MGWHQDFDSVAVSLATSGSDEDEGGLKVGCPKPNICSTPNRIPAEEIRGYIYVTKHISYKQLQILYLVSLLYPCTTNIFPDWHPA